jgi:transcriptional regulator with XRE-family HTH domain
MTPEYEKELRNLRVEIGRTVRELRQERRWTQAELADRLLVSQSGLSKIERGERSLTAEQLLVLQRLFNSDADRFTSSSSDQTSTLQNALARLGAVHLHESQHVLPSRRFSDVNVLLREVLLAPSPRLIAALAPVLVRNIDNLSLNKVYGDLAEVGRERRLGWLVDNTAAALRTELQTFQSREWGNRYRRALTTLEEFVRFAVTRRGPVTESLDLLDPEVRSKRTVEALKRSASEQSTRWGIITRHQPEDFVTALRAARDDR